MACTRTLPQPTLWRHLAAQLGMVAALASCDGTAPNADLTASSSELVSTLSQNAGSPIKPKKDGGKCLDVNMGRNADGTPIQIATCYGNEAQAWNYVDGQLKVFGNKCLDVPGGKQANGVKLHIWTCDKNNANQKWTRKGNTFVWRNAYCLDLEGGNTVDLTRVQIWACGTNNVNQQWAAATGSANNSGNTAPAANTTPAPAQQAPSAPSAPGVAYSSNAIGASGKAQAQPAGSLNVTDFGARGDGNGDHTQALQRAFDAAGAQGKTLYIPAGTFNHSGVIKANGIKVVGAGTSTILRATNPTNSAVVLTGANGVFSNFTTQVAANIRSSQPYDCAVLLIGARNAQVSYVDVQGASANGFRIDSSEACTITKSLVNGSNADGVALVNGAIKNVVSYTQVSNASDDSFSSNSYPGERQNSGNVFANCYAGPNDKQGRGFCMMGSAGETVKNSVSQGSLWHGIVAGTDPGSTTQAGFDFTIINNLVVGNASGLPVMITHDGGFNQTGGLANVSGTQTSGDPSATLGWSPVAGLPNPSSFNSYTGGGPGSSNTPGNRG